MEGRKISDPKDWFPIDVVLTGILIRIQQGNATDIDRWFCRSVFDRIHRRGHAMEARPLMRQVLAMSPYRISRWVSAMKGRYLFEEDVEIATALLLAESDGLLGPEESKGKVEDGAL